MRKRTFFYRAILPASACLVLLVTVLTQTSVGQGYRGGSRGGYGYNPVRDFNASSFGVSDLPGPQPAGGGGVLGSSMYSGGSPRGTGSSQHISGGSSGPNNTSLMAQGAPRSTQVYNPMQPTTVTIGAGGQTALATFQQNAPQDQFVTATSDLAQNAEESVTITRPALTSLAPPQEGIYRDAMLNGEKALKASDFDDAATKFNAAKKAAPKNTPEPLLSLFHVALATADGDYAQSADYLGQALKAFPTLALARVYPEAFYADGEYDTILKALTTHVDANTNDANAAFVLAYLTWRGGNATEAINLLDAAAGNASDDTLAGSIALLQESFGKLKSNLVEAGPAMQEPVDYPWAGVRMALPEGFKQTQLTQINGIFAASGGNLEAPQRASLTVYPLPHDMDLTTLMDAITKDMDARIGVSEVKIEGDAIVPFYDKSAIIRQMSLEYSGNTFVGARVCFIRDVKTPSGEIKHVAYVLGLGMLEAHANELLPSLAAMMRSMEPIDFESPINLPVSTEGQQIADPQLGFSIHQPNGWAGAFDEDGFSMGQFDPLSGGIVSPRVEVIVHKITDGHTPQSIGQAAIEARTAEGFTMTVISHGETQLAGKDGYEFIVRKDHPGDDTTPAHSWIEMAQIVSVDVEGDQQNMVALVVRSCDAEVGKTMKIMESFAPTLKLTTGGAD